MAAVIFRYFSQQSDRFGKIRHHEISNNPLQLLLRSLLGEREAGG